MGMLTETQIKAAKPVAKEYFLNDGDNLFLRVRRTGKAWVYRYEWEGQPAKLGFAPTPRCRSHKHEPRRSRLPASGPIGK